MSGRLFIVVGPSGAGKDTLAAGAVARDSRLNWARRVITRPQAPGSEPFESASPAEFQRRLAGGEFTLHWQAHGLSYGVAKTEFAPLAEGHDLLLNGSRAVLGEILAQFPKLQILHVTAPMALIAERLAKRGRETAADIDARLTRGDYAFPPRIPVHEVINDATPEIGLERFLSAIAAARQHEYLQTRSG